MKVRMLDTVEDSNEFDPKEVRDVKEVPKHTISQNGVFRSEPNEEGKLVKVLVRLKRVDKLRKDADYDLPDRQARNLIRLRYAEEVSADAVEAAKDLR